MMSQLDQKLDVFRYDLVYRYIQIYYILKAIYGVEIETPD